MDSENKKRQRVQCAVCSGSGLVKKSVILCEKCDGKKCMFCGESGYAQQPYERCEACWGDGEVDVDVDDN